MKGINRLNLNDAPDGVLDQFMSWLIKYELYSIDFFKKNEIEFSIAKCMCIVLSARMIALLLHKNNDLNKDEIKKIIETESECFIKNIYKEIKNFEETNKNG